MHLVIAAMNLDGIGRIIVRLGSMLMAVTPALVVASYVVCALVWIISAGNKKLVRWAREQFIATTVVFFILCAYFVIKDLALYFSHGFG